MSSTRLRSQFESLFERFNGQDSTIQIEDVTDIFQCTRRNARMVLNKLVAEEWIEWHPAAGRGKLSQLIFKQNRYEVSELLARRYLEEGKIRQALDVLDSDANRLTQVLQNYLGLQQQQGLQVIRLPYYRALSMLNPRQPTRRSERHIINQIFSGLTCLDDNEQLQPDLAHAWESLSSTHWRFYIRPGVRFHNGHPLQIEHLIENLTALTTINLFSHIKSVASYSPWSIDIYLSKPDRQLPFFLASSSAKILPPQSMQTDSFDRLPIGTGSYQVESNSDQRLILKAFDGYFGFRPLLDQIEVWVVDEAFSFLVYPSLSKQIKPVRHSLDEVELDPGCTYLLLNRNNGIAADPIWANYFSTKLSTFNLFNYLPEDKVIELGLLHAHGIKPGWYHKSGAPKQHKVPIQKEALLPQSQNRSSNQEVTVNLAYHGEHPAYPYIVQAIEKILKQDGIVVNKQQYYRSISELEGQIDLWIKPMGIATHRDDALAVWLLENNDIKQMSSTADFEKWQQLVEQWRESEDKNFSAKELGQQLIESHQIIPMFHCWLGVSKGHCGSLQNAKCNALGWLDFSQIWVKPEIIHR